MKNLRYMFLKIVFISIFCLFFSRMVDAEASIVLKAAIVNPSPDIEKEIELKVPLPKEVRPEHIISSGDLEVHFDPQKSVYYVYKSFMVPPKGSVVREVEIEDIWVINEYKELTPLAEEAERTWIICKNSKLANQAGFLKNDIDSKLNQIIQAQSKTALNPQVHISDYRKNLERLLEIKADVESLNQIAGRIKPISGKVIWRLILAVVIFLTVITVIFVGVWSRYLKSPVLEKLKPYEQDDEQI